MLTIRPALSKDAPLLLQFIRELAEYEREAHAVVATEEDLLRDGFRMQPPKFRALIAEWDGTPVGYALFFSFYSTWEGRHGIFLEDLFVRDALRGKGIGKALIAHVARIARTENCFGMRWEVLDWNEPAINFYKSLGANFLDGWRTVLLQREAMTRLAGGQQE
jgi:GNAT superfamily N-acetyltransferase